MEKSEQPVPQQCPVCGESEMTGFFRTTGAPVFCNVLWPTARSALAAPRSTINLAFCEGCGLIYNTAFDPLLLKYTEEYENSLNFSPRFQHYAEELALRLVERYQLYGKDIVEIGCGQGDFLSLLTEAGGNRGLGFDPSYDASKAMTRAGAGVSILPELYSELHAAYPADLVCCRHVLEHIAQPLGFMQSVRRAVGERTGTVVFFEVPNALYTLQRLSVWDIIYEHCSYFTPRSLQELFLRAEFDPSDVLEQFEGQYLTIEARARQTQPQEPVAVPEMDIAEVCLDFEDSCNAKMNLWRQIIRRQHEDNRRLVVWGAGAKGVTFLNMLNVPTAAVEYVVDVNPRKHGRYVPGTAQQIVPPSFLQSYRPHAVIIMNSIYRGEIEQLLTEMGLGAEIILAHEPVMQTIDIGAAALQLEA